MKETRIPRLLSILTLVIAPALSLTGCDILDEGIPESARIDITGPQGETFQLITTNDFDIISGDEGETRDVYLYSADTVTVTIPYSNRYSLGSGIRFYAKAYSDEGLSQPLTMKVFVDGNQRYNSTSTLLDLQLEFVYSYR